MSLVDDLLEIAREAAAIINQVYAAPFEVEYKTPRDPVTLADRRANDHICTRLEAAFPGVPIVAEESDPASFADFRAATRVFFVDPLDGTREFVKRNGEFVVMIGLLDGDRPEAGVIHAPATGESWLGVRGQRRVSPRSGRSLRVGAEPHRPALPGAHPLDALPSHAEARGRSRRARRGERRGVG